MAREYEGPFELVHYTLNCTKGLPPSASTIFVYRGRRAECCANGEGLFDAFMKALCLAWTEMKMTEEFPLPRITDYHVSMVPGGKSSSAEVAVSIVWENNFTTTARNADQCAAAIEATMQMINLLLRARYEDMVFEGMLVSAVPVPAY